MKPARLAGEVLLVGLLLGLPVLAFSPAWRADRLLAPGDGAALHFPLRLQAWRSWPELPSWNPSIFCGEPLLSGYRAGALYPPFALLALLEDPLLAFNLLILCSMAAAGVLTYLYLRSLGSEPVGGYLAGLSFALGPYAVGHFEDSATIVAMPLLPLLLWATEFHLRKGPAPARLAVCLALLFLAGSPEASRAGLLLLAIRLLAEPFSKRARSRSWQGLGAVAAGVLLASPQLLPTLLASLEAGRGATGVAARQADLLPGLTGQVLRYVSHTPAPAFALAALPLLFTDTAVWHVALAFGLCGVLQWGRGPLAAPGALSLGADLSLASLAGLSLSAQWQSRLSPSGSRLRAYLLVACLASALALPASTVALGPLPGALAPAVGLLALSLILYISLSGKESSLAALAFLLPLTLSFLLQPGSRGAWQGAPPREELFEGTPIAQSVTRAMGQRQALRTMTLVRSWPREEARDLLYANLASVLGRRSANGYDPMVPRTTRQALGNMSAMGTLPGAFFRSDPTLLELLGVHWVQVPTTALTVGGDAMGLGDTLDIVLEPGRPHFVPLPIARATEIRVASLLSDAVDVAENEPIARVVVSLASGRELSLELRAGRDTAEWAYDRPDVRPAVRHSRAQILESFQEAGTGFEGHRYLGVLSLPGRYLIDGLRFERLPGPGRLSLSRIGVFDGKRNEATAPSLVAGYVSDTAHFREAAHGPTLRLFELPSSLGHAWVVARLRVVPGADAVLRDLDFPEATGFDPRKEALAVASDIEGVQLPGESAASRAEVVASGPSELRVRAAGPGLLVLAESFDPGWAAEVDEKPARVVRVNHAQMGIVLPQGTHAVALQHRARGLLTGFFLSGSTALVLVGLALPRLTPGKSA